ncbi:MAG: cell division protein ZapB, partial [Klebsiella quasipneumoniae]
AIDTITLLQMEIEELKEKNNTLVQEVQSAQHGREELERENSQLKEQQQGWQERLQALLGRMEEV